MIRVEHDGEGIATVTIDNLAARNAMTFAMWDALRDHARALDADPSVRVVVITGAGGAAFVSGTAITEFRGFTADDGAAYERRMDAVMEALEAIRVPVIAAIAGACTGGGVAIASTCDLRIGEPAVRIGVPIARTLGNCLSIANLARVADLVGVPAAKALLFSARLLDAQAALHAGLLNEVVLDVDALLPRAHEIARGMLALAPLTLRATKEGFRRLRAARALPAGSDLIRACYGSDDFREGVTAFLEKRAPRWSGT
ncbi:MAG TPA: enoyl-CoA hydratase [Candidatus Sulfotelmatobacter sp.]|nr:enoyl-CoA hydratase [Candidatus Sulfotelmatobacter sp.]